MKALTMAVLKAGLIPPEHLAQAEQWGHPMPDVATTELTLTQTAQLFEYARDALEGTDIRETNPDVVHDYMASTVPVTLVVLDTSGAKHSMKTHGSWVGPGEREIVVPWSDKLAQSNDDPLADVPTLLTATLDGVSYRCGASRVVWVDQEPTFLVIEVQHG